MPYFITPEAIHLPKAIDKKPELSYEAIGLLACITERYLASKPIPISELRLRSGIDAYHLNDLLAELVEAGFLRKGYE